mmetsp:Transcript_2700/g.4229  ORF Transcript_2700/g.4229 Transcript_2700/m.4229 type:complete len:81 (+) Transcript_2700:1607-1849(+)
MVNKVDLAYFSNRPSSDKNYFILAVNTLRGVGISDSQGRVPVDPTQTMGVVFQIDEDGRDGDESCYSFSEEAAGSKLGTW